MLRFLLALDVFLVVLGKGFDLSFNCQISWSWRIFLLPPLRSVRLDKLGMLAWCAPFSGGGGGAPQSVLANYCWVDSAAAVRVGHWLLYSSWSKEVKILTLSPLNCNCFCLLNVWTLNNDMGEKQSGTICNQRNGHKWFKQSQLENAWWTRGLNLTLQTLHVHLVELQLYLNCYFCLCY